MPIIATAPSGLDVLQQQRKLGVYLPVSDLVSKGFVLDDSTVEKMGEALKQEFILHIRDKFPQDVLRSVREGIWN